MKARASTGPWIARGLALAAALLTGLATPAHAQSSDARARAEAAHERGLSALEALEFATARDLFRESLGLFPSLGSAFNLGLALRGTGEVREAARTWARLLEGSFGEVAAEQRAEVEALLSGVRARVAWLDVRVTGPREVSVDIGGEPRGVRRRDDRSLLDLDPGRHVVSLSATAYEPLVRTVVLDPGERATFEVTLEPRATTAASSGVFDSPVFWIVVGAVVVGASAAAVFVATGPHTAPVTDRPPFGVVET